MVIGRGAADGTSGTLSLLVPLPLYECSELLEPAFSECVDRAARARAERHRASRGATLRHSEIAHEQAKS